VRENRTQGSVRGQSGNWLFYLNGALMTEQSEDMWLNATRIGESGEEKSRFNITGSDILEKSQYELGMWVVINGPNTNNIDEWTSHIDHSEDMARKRFSHPTLRFHVLSMSDASGRTIVFACNERPSENSISDYINGAKCDVRVEFTQHLGPYPALVKSAVSGGFSE